MKKLLCLVMMFALAVSLFSGCGCSKKYAPDDVTAIEEAKENAPVVEVEKPEISENKEVVTADKAPEVVIIVDEKDDTNRMCYHLKDCKTLKGRTTQDITWEIVKTVGFWQCPTCNPPKYEGYVNGEN